MKSGTFVLIAACAVAALAGTVWIFGAGRVTTPPAETTAPAPDGPAAKAVLDEYVHDFGVMAVYQKGRHTFTIRNEGDAPLTLEKGQTTCKCTLSHVAEGAIPPGGSAEIELEWVPREPAHEFVQSAKIKTNDPYRAQIMLKIMGRVETVVHLEPTKSWELGQIRNDGSSEITGYVFSSVLDQFNVLALESSAPALVAKFDPMDDGAKTRLKAKSGYAITAKISQEIPIGKFQEMLTIKTDIKSPLPHDHDHSAADHQHEDQADDGLVLAVGVSGARQGPMKILGPGWNNDDMSLKMGTFPARDGKQVVLSMFLTDLDDIGDFKVKDFEIQEIQPDLSFLKVTAQKDQAFAAEGRQKYNITVEVLPGSPPLVKTGENPAKATIRTNHPDAKEFDIHVKFVSR